LRVVLKESLKQDTAFRDELEALLKALPKTEASQSANVVGDSNIVNQAAGQGINITVGDRK
jgi:ribonuclease HI